MANYGSNSLQIEVDDSGGTPRNMSNYVTAINSFSVEAILNESTAFGDSWEESLYTGVKMVGNIEMEGFYDDTASTGPNAVFSGIGDTRTVKITWGGGKSSSVEAIISKYERIAQVKNLTKYKVTFKPTGAVTEV